MFIIQGPVPSIQETILLPSPQFSDGEALTHELNVKRAVTGRVRVYVKRKPRRRLLWDFLIDRQVALQLESFLRSFHSRKIQVVDHNNRRWHGWVINNPFEFNTGSSGRPDHSPTRGEMMATRLEFEGFET
jgi:hypothetical protein